MTVRRLLPLAPFALAACHSASTGTPAAPAVTADQTAIAAAVVRDYAARYSGNACIAPQTIARKGPDPIPPVVAGKAITWTYLERNAQGAYELVDDQLESTLASAWAQARKRDYPAITLPASVQAWLHLSMTIHELHFVSNLQNRGHVSSHNYENHQLLGHVP